MSLRHGQLPRKSMPARIAIPARCAATIAAICVAGSGIVAAIGHAPSIQGIEKRIAG
jgi:hypothetical protein